MAGTYADQATLASMNEFTDKVRVAMISRAITQYFSADPQTFKVLQQAKAILDNGGSDAARIAALVATGVPSIAAAAPAVPTDADTLSGVTVVMDALLQ